VPNSMHSLGPGVSLAELGSLSVFVDHVSEESMTPGSGCRAGSPWWGCGVVGVVEVCRLAVWRWGGRWSGYPRELVLGMIVLV
jgi:hypothetical protein